MSVLGQFQFRRDVASAWTSANPILLAGEMGIETDTNKFKIGDGTTPWNSLPYGGIQGPPGSAGSSPTYFGVGGNSAGQSTVSGSSISLYGGSNLTISAGPGALTFNAATFRTDYAGTGFSGTNVSGTVDTAGISLSVASVPARTISLGGNSVGDSTITANQLFIAGGNNITLSGSSNSYTISGASFRTDYAGTGFSGTNVSGTVNTAGVSLSVASQTSFVLSNSNGVSFGTNGSTVTASVKTDYAGTGFSGTNISGTVNTAGLSLSAAPPGPALSAGTQLVNSGTIKFANSNGITFGLSVSTQMTASVRTNYAGSDFVTTTSGGSLVAGTLNTSGFTLAVPSFITTAALSDHSHGNPTLALTNLSGTTASNSAGFTLSLSAGAAGGAAYSFVDSNNVSFTTTNGTQVVASASYSNDGLNRLAAGTQTAGTLATVNFANSNGITFGMSGSSQITGSVKTDYAGTGFATTTSAGSVVSGTHNTNGLTLGIPSFITTAALSDHSHGNPTLALTNLSGTTASNSAGLTLSLSAAPQTQYVFSNSNNVSFGTNGSTVTATASYSNDGFNRLAAGTQTAGSATTVNFADSNGVTFGMSNSSQITASVRTNYAGSDFATTTSAGSVIAGTMNTSGLTLGVPNFLTTAALSDHSHGNPTLALTNLTGTTASNSAGFTLSLSAAPQTQYVFSNSNNVSFGTNGSTVTATASYSNDGFNRLAAGTQTAGSATTVNFANSNGISFGMSGSSQITGSVRTDYAGTQFATTTSGGSVVAGTLNTSGLTLGIPAFITTAALSDHSHGNPTLALTNLSGTTASNSAGLTLSLSAAPQTQYVFSNSNNISFGTNGSTVTATASYSNDGLNRLAAGTQTAGTLATVNFADSNGITFGMSASSQITASVRTNYAGTQFATTTSAGSVIAGTLNTTGLTLGVPNFLTTAALSDHSHGNPTLALTNLSGTTASNSAGFTLSLSAGAGAALSFVNSNNVSFTTTNGTQVVASASYSNDGFNRLAAGTQTAGSATTVNFADSNGVTFGMSNSSQITASVRTNYAGTQFSGTNISGTIDTAGISLSVASDNGVALSAGTQLVNSGTIKFANSNGITFGLSLSTQMTASVRTNYAGSDFATTTSAGSVIAGTMNTSGLTLGVPGFLTEAAATNHTHGNPTLALTNLSGTTASNFSGLTISLSAAAAGGGGVALSAGTTQATNGTVSFANSNGVSFGLNGQTLTASVSTDYAATNHTHGSPTLALTNLSGTTASNFSGLTLSLSGPPMIVEYAGIMPNWNNPSFNGLQTNLTAINGIPILFPVLAEGNATLGGTAIMGLSRATSGSNRFTAAVALYSYVNSTSLGLLTSFSNSFSGTQTASQSGTRRIIITAPATFTSPPGELVVGLHFTCGGASTASMNYSLLGASLLNPAFQGEIFAGADSYNTVTNTGTRGGFHGRYSTTSASFPSGIALSQMVLGIGASVAPISPNFLLR